MSRGPGCWVDNGGFHDVPGAGFGLSGFGPLGLGFGCLKGLGLRGLPLNPKPTLNPKS